MSKYNQPTEALHYYHERNRKIGIVLNGQRFILPSTEETLMDLLDILGKIYRIEEDSNMPFPFLHRTGSLDKYKAGHGDESFRQRMTSVGLGSIPTSPPYSHDEPAW